MHIVKKTESIQIRVKGTVQGVGFRPTVWRLAQDYQLVGEVCNDGEGVLIEIAGDSKNISLFLEELPHKAPPLAKIESIEVEKLYNTHSFPSFRITDSRSGSNRTRVTADAALCQACRTEVLDPGERRYGYPFTNCTHCGPRLSIVETVPYDRINTTMSPFTMCEQCSNEYGNPADRRFHAQPIACPDCGPEIWLEHADTGPNEFKHLHNTSEVIDTTCNLLSKGDILAVRGLGGFHLCCDASNETAVNRLRERKHRYAKPFALMAHSTDMIRKYCVVSDLEKEQLESPEAPIVLLQSNPENQLPDGISPGSNLLGFMLPYTPLHLLISKQFGGPLVMTSGNLSDEPQITGNEEARSKLHRIADALLLHNREIANRIDDSVVRIMAGKPRLLRRARGYAPRAISLPEGFDGTPDLLAYGGELKSTFCLIKDGAAVISQHQGDLEDVHTYDDYEKNLTLYQELFSHKPDYLVADMHPEYLSTKLARATANEYSLGLFEVQHHHAHIASCLAENHYPINSKEVLGVALDGLGYGEDGTIWGGEFILADYKSYRRMGTFKPVPMIGGVKAIIEPWRNTYAQIAVSMGWSRFKADFKDTQLFRYLREKPIFEMDKMLQNGINVPPASSCGRLFDAVAAAIGLCPDRAYYEGQGAIELEMLANSDIDPDPDGYPFQIVEKPGGQFFYIDPEKMWNCLFTDLASGIDKALIAKKFHKGLIETITIMICQIHEYCKTSGIIFDTVALSGGCFQNKIILEGASGQIQAKGFQCLTQSEYPANDGGLSLGQAVIAASRLLN